MFGIKKKALELTYQHLLIRKDGSKIADPWEIVDDQNCHSCGKCKKAKVVRKFVIYGSIYNPKLSKTCKNCIDYNREQDAKRKRGEYKEECYWLLEWALNKKLIRRKTDYASTPAKIVCSTCEDSD